MKKMLTMTTLITSLLMSTMAGASAPEQGEKKYSVAPKVPIEAYAFSLSDVRLLDGPFKKAMDLDAKYLLDLQPDRFMSLLRKQAGLKPKGEIYGGWEGRGLAGHVLGHYISACSMMYAASGDKRYADRVHYLVDELAECQKAYGSGYVGGVPEAKRIFAEVAAGKIVARKFSLNKGWVPWYNLHKLYAGLVDAYRICGSDKARKIVIGMTDWAAGVTGKLTDKQMQSMFACEIGGMNEALADIYAITGKAEHLKLATRFNDMSVLGPLSKRQDRLEGLHANTQAPKVIGVARQYELTGNKDFRIAAEFFWEEVTRHRSYVNGGNSEREHFRTKGELWKRLTPSTSETCNTYNMLKLTRHLFAWTAEEQYADYYERALYNHILASQEPKKGGMIYFCELKPGHFHTYSTRFESFWCCTGTGIENHVKYGDSIYFHDDNSLHVNLFIASELKWKTKGLKIAQQTKFPYEPKTRFVFTCEKPVKIALKIRHPKWAGPVLKATVNGKKVVAASKPGEYLAIDRSWVKGDAVDVELPMSLRLEPMENRPQIMAIMYGPILLAGQLGREGMTDKMPYSPLHWAFGGTPTPPVPDLAAEGKPVAEWLKPVSGKPLEFKTAGVGRPREVSLIPFYKAHHQRYTVYWDIMTDKAWRRQEARRVAQEKRLKDLKERTIDEARPDKESEKAHNLKGGNMLAGAAFGRHWRHAWPGSYFSYEMKVDPDKPVDVVVTCWGGDKGNRGFDIKVGDTKIGSQTLTGAKPGEFFDTTHPIPEKFTKGKAKVTVRFEAHKGKIGGGIFGVRTARRKAKP
ncbi:MAG: glycoside hydrolase family 127 protein [Phycisphaerae bacterium]|nr:glycoside hydrolase family 127 protein [Phycisphaerae bacterium]